MLKKKKLIVGISMAVVIVGLLILLSFTLFSVKTIELDFRTSHQNVSFTDEEIIEKGKIKKGGSVFFLSKKAMAENIENSHPYLKVVNIEIVFPSKLVVHLSQREEVYAVEYKNGHYICDEEMRVLRTSDSYVNTPQNAMLIEGLDVGDLYVPGDYLPDATNPYVYQNLFENNRHIGEQRELIEKIELTTRYDQKLKRDLDVVKMKLFGGQTVTIANFDKKAGKKTHLFLEIYSSLFSMIGKESLQEDDTSILLNADNLKTCEIYIYDAYATDRIDFKILVEAPVEE